MDTAALPLLTKLPRVDADGAEYDYVLLHVSSAGDKTFDLKLIGTESDNVFKCRGKEATRTIRWRGPLTCNVMRHSKANENLYQVKHTKTSDFKAKNFTGDQKQWEEVLSVALLGATETESTRGVEAVTKVDSRGPSIIINIQKSIEGITQKLGTITLTKTEADKDSPDMFEWCGLTLNAKQNATRELAELRDKMQKKDEETEKLNDTLAELVALKNAHEDDLAQKFSILLNEKKLKIRDQQRLLAAANVDPGKLEEVERNRVAERSSSPGPSRTRKRKAGKGVKDESDDETDDGFEKMDVDAAKPELDSDEEERHTEDEKSTADEDSGDNAPAVPFSVRDTDILEAARIEPASKPTTESDFTALPPKRDLPFAKKLVARHSRPVEGSETEDDDDEL